VFEKRHAAAVEPAQRCCKLLERVHTHRLEVVAEHRFDGALPTGLHLERLRQSRLPGGSRQPRQPGTRARILLAQRRLLQGFERHQFGARLLALLPQRFEAAVGAALRVAQPLHLPHRRLQLAREGIGHRARRRLAFGQALDRRIGTLRGEGIEFEGQAVGLRLQAVALAFQLLDARGLHLRALSGSPELAIKALPVLLPARKFRFRLRQRARGQLLAGAPRVHQGLELGDLGAQPRELLFVAHDLLRDGVEVGVHLRQVGAGPLAQLARIADVLLGARHFGPELVVARLHQRGRVAELGVEFTLLLDRRFRRALLCQRPLHVELARTHGAVLHRRAAIELAQPQRQQLGGQGALLRFEFLIAPRGVGLALQVADLLVDLIAQILQAREILACLGHAHLGLPAALLIQ
jgi:hypothetical protein